MLALDRAHVWHPYSSVPGTSAPLVVESAAGVRLRLAEPFEGHRELIDGMSSWWAAIHGYAHPVLDAAVRDQLGRMSHVMFGGLTHEPAVRLATRLVELSPAGLEHVFFSDSGSVAVEVAAKMCLQYWRSVGQPRKQRLLTWRGGYHGDTFHPMSVCDPDGGMHHLWTGVLPRQVFAEEPPVEFEAAYARHLVALIEAHADELAAVIVEPVVQGAGGMRFHSPEYLRVLREATTAAGVLLIFDEIATGFGRTGAYFAADHAGVSPDVMCVGKALSGGYLSFAATLCTTEVADGISRGSVPVLAHGPTFMGNPLACAVANASLDLLDGGAWRTDVKRIEAVLRSALAPAVGAPGVADVRVLGAIGVIQLDHEVDIAAATRAAGAQGVWLRPFRDLVYTMPPYVTEDADVERIAEGMVAAATAG
ncbi:adenosylmethionine--8-amino-7-oxononanoate transaminase [Planosporangium thailandense]|uniref:Adenosylmethionine-8-amino-7-oxononanoate aminotransferase n=1 Tax=Planosporangium thailandense TaxID=765197 RepID=A0ABX0XXN4_9ACTN|nr:adenosylmethionine--8-amino-7-oxononanoate transaminase [Planosporangium thailandense]NJC70800.1 adenosylmethionine--8-amino-7-oxononanoate transaminase [Planosporangium thailandense]